MRVGRIGGAPPRPFGGFRLSPGVFRQKLANVAQRVPFLKGFHGIGPKSFIGRRSTPKAVQGFLQTGRQVFNGLVQKWGIRDPIRMPFFPFPPVGKAWAKPQLPRLTDIQRRLPSLPSLRPSLPKGIGDKFGNLVSKLRIKPMDVGKIWKDFQSELGRHVGGAGRRPPGDVLAPYFPFPPIPPTLARIDLGAFRQRLTGLARRVPFPSNFGGLRFLRGLRAKAIQNALKTGFKAFGDLVQKWGIRPSAHRPTAPFSPLGKQAIGRPSTSAPSGQKSIPEELKAKLQKSWDPGKVWHEFQKELGRHLHRTPVSLAATTSQAPSTSTGASRVTASKVKRSVSQASPTSTQTPQPGRLYGNPKYWMNDWKNWKYVSKLQYTLFWDATWTTGHKIHLFRAIDELQNSGNNPLFIKAYARIAEFVFKKYSLPSIPLSTLLSMFTSFDSLQIANEVVTFHHQIVKYRKAGYTPQAIIQMLQNSEIYDVYNKKLDPEALVSLYIAVTGDTELTGKF